MKDAPQEIRTFFVTSVSHGRRAIFQSTKMARLLIDVLTDNRAKGRFLLHEFVVMPDHFHLMITPAPEVPLGKALQYIKGGYSFRVKAGLVKNPEEYPYSSAGNGAQVDPAPPTLQRKF